ncbi:zinc finger protein zat3 [Phtheirospermum japonicum]|uniref:Zinc finger protein zat3 n=1 Tax=Phtheirospermum japonicum TaxID=374723 RepID=A0A830B798_9LAMI|nr:zinc finger protein zat3 [Phtheirospermum japonicum]
MACIDDQQPNFKHYCRVCKKGFMCGRALGGHMRAHGIGDENGNLDDDDDDPISDWEEKFGGGSNKKMYQLRTNPNRLKSCRTCENCGKEFLSWKSFLEHGKCSSDDASESLVSSPESEDDDGTGGTTRSRWSKRKRSLRSKVGCFSSSYPPSEDEDILLARCLVQLANTAVDPPAAEPEESCASAEERRNPSSYFGAPKSRAGVTFDHKAKGVSTPKGMFECKACKKVFNSHQALGGHRASHKKVKGCYAAKQDQMVQDDSNSALAIEDDVITNNNEEFLIPPSKPTPSNYQFEQGHALVGAARRKSKVHECSICHRVFTSGQALGGHKRCHWITSNSPETSSLPKFNFQDNTNNINEKPAIDVSDKLDLNVPAWAHVSGLMRDPPDPLSLDVSTDMQLQPWIAPGGKDNTGLHCHSQELIHLKKGDDNNITNGNITVGNNGKNETVDSKNTATRYVEDEADSKLIKLAKLSDLNDLKEMDNSGSSSQWLQVGIGSSTKASANV